MIYFGYFSFSTTHLEPTHLEWSLTRAKNKGKDHLVIHKSGRGHLRELLISECLSDNSNGVSQ